MNNNFLKIQYFLYSSLIFLTYINSLNIIHPTIKWGVNKFWYLNIIIFIFLILCDKKSIILKRTALPLFFLLIYATFVSISCFLNFNFLLGFGNSLVAGICYLIIFYSYLVLSQHLSVEKLILPFFISSVFIVLMSFFVFLGYEPNFYLEDTELLDNYLDFKFGGDLIGFSGIYLNQNGFSMSLIIAIISTFIFLQSKNNDLLNKKIILILFFMACIIFLFLTMSRAAIFSILILFILFFIRGIRSKINFYMLSLLAIFLTGILIVFNDFFVFFMERVNNDGTSSRAEIWQDAWSVFLNYPYFGVGDYQYVGISGKQLSTHNVYFNILVSYGIFSFISWMFLVFTGVYYSMKNLINLNFSIHRNIIFISIGFLVILIHQFFENTIASTFAPLTLFFILILSILVVKRKTDIMQ